MFYTSHTFNWCVQWSMKIVWIEDKVISPPSFFSTQRNHACHCVFLCLSSIGFLFFIYYFIFPIGEKKSAVVMSSTCIIFFPSIFYVRYNQQCVHHIKQTLSPPTAVHFIYQQALLLRTRVYLRPSMQPWQYSTYCLVHVITRTNRLLLLLQSRQIC
jgi:hypothetical protein